MTRPAFDRTKVTTTTEGTGPLSLGTAVSNRFQAFSGGLDSMYVSYSLEHQSDVQDEAGYGVYSSGTLSRLYQTYPTVGGSPINLTPGTKHVRITPLASDVTPNFDDVNPTVTDDIAHGYRIGNFWVNTLLKLSWICVDHTVGAAVWRKAQDGNLITELNNATSVAIDDTANGKYYVLTSLTEVGLYLGALTTVGVRCAFAPGGAGVVVVHLDAGAGYWLPKDDTTSGTPRTLAYELTGYGYFECVRNTGGSAAEWLFIGAGNFPKVLDADLSGGGRTIDGYNIRRNSGVSGVLDVVTHGGAYNVVTGDVTVPTIIGFWCYLFASGASHQVNFQNTPLDTPLTDGHKYHLVVRSTTATGADLTDMGARLAFSVPTDPGALPTWALAADGAGHPGIGTVLTGAGFGGPTGADHVVQLPSHATGDALILVVAIRNNEMDAVVSLTASAIAAGWEEIATQGGAQLTHLGVFAKIGDGSETSVSFHSVGGGTTPGYKALVYRFAGADGFRSPLWASDYTTNNTGVTSAVAPNVTPTGINELGVFFLATTGQRTPGTVSGESGGSWILRHTELTGTNLTISMHTADLSAGAAITGGTVDIDVNSTTAVPYVTIGFTLIPGLV